jgi:hypothetical protein
MILFLDVLGALLFVLSSIILWHERYKKNRLLMILAGILALGSSYFLVEEVTKRFVHKPSEE